MTTSKAAWEERFEDLGNVACNDDFGHQFRCNGCQLEAATEVSSRYVEAVQFWSDPARAGHLHRRAANQPSTR